MTEPVVEIAKSFGFEAAHLLPNVPEGHKCARLHGHSFRVELRVAGPIAAESGWVTDFADLTDVWAPLHDELDHRYLNDVDGLANPTSERIAVWVWDRLAPTLPGLLAVTVHETCTASATYRGASA
jgi:6-pyruvoyltetrahydropterin/6-carboxytetrahydropterin synthase